MQVASEDEAVLDNPVWHSLAGAHAHFAQGHGRARRYRSDVSMFAGLPDDRDGRAWQDLADLIGPGSEVILSAVDLDPPKGWEAVFRGAAVQMVDVSVDAAPDGEAVRLGVADSDDMADLVARAKPGPWRRNTYELGGYLGIRRNGRLVAFAGERLHPGGWSEISAVATDAEYRGQGLGTRLVRAVTYDIRARGERAVLHAATTNVDAIRLYEKLGFSSRGQTTFAVFRSPG